MENNNSDLLFSLLRFELFSKDLTEEEKNSAYQNISSLMKLSKKQDLAHLIADAFIRLGLVSKEDEVFEKLEKEKLSAIFRSVKMERELFAITGALTEAGIVHIPLKGSVIRALYPEPYMRTSCDIDLLVKEEDLSAAVKVLEEKLKYTTDGERKFHDISLYSPSGIHLELHFSILENHDSLDRVLIRVFDYVKESKPGSFTYELSSEFLVFHVLAHASYHFIRGGSGIKPFIDLYLLNQKIKYDREKLLLLCREAGIEKFLDAAQLLCQSWFGGAEHSELTKKMEGYIFNGGVYGTAKNAAVVEQAKGGGKFKRIMTLIFMPYETLKTIYPSLENRRFLTPIYQVRRWFRILFGGRLGKAVKTIKTNAMVSEEARKEATELFTELGL